MVRFISTAIVLVAALASQVLAEAAQAESNVLLERDVAAPDAAQLEARRRGRGRGCNGEKISGSHSACVIRSRPITLEAREAVVEDIEARGPKAEELEARDIELEEREFAKLEELEARELEAELEARDLEDFDWVVVVVGHDWAQAEYLIAVNHVRAITA